MDLTKNPLHKIFAKPYAPFQLIRQKRFMVLQVMIAALTNILSLALPIMMLQTYDRIIPHQSYGTLIVLAAGVVVSLILDSALRVIRAVLTSRLTGLQEHAASCHAVRHVCHSDINAFQAISTGEHLQNMTALGRLREFYSGQALTALVDLPFVFLFLGLIAYLGSALVIVPVTLLALFLVLAVASGHDLKDALERRAEQDQAKAGYLVTILSGIHTVKAFAMEQFALRGFELKQGNITRENYRVALANGQTNVLAAFFGQLSIIATATIGTLLVLDNQLSVGGLSACTLLAGRTIQPIQRILGTWLRLQDIAVAKQQANTLFALPLQTRATDHMPSLSGAITLENVTYKTLTDQQPLLNRVNLTIAPGEVVAFSGPKGSGKSTLLHMIAGLIPPTSGAIRLDGCEPSLCDTDQLAAQIAYLPQRATIFKGTLLDNITGFRNDTASVTAAKDIGQQLGLEPVINALPRGYQTLLQDSPSDPIPPGVKQRIALARALLPQPKIILFDDADRALDKEGYNRLFRLMGRLKGKTTILLVSQDNNLLSFADRFYNLTDGRLTPETILPSQRLVFLTQQKGQAA